MHTILSKVLPSPENPFDIHGILDQVQNAAHLIEKSGINLLEQYNRAEALQILQSPQFDTLRSTIKSLKDKDPEFMLNFAGNIEGQLGTTIELGTAMLEIIGLVGN